jgi:SAM-dependent methyltransferase
MSTENACPICASKNVSVFFEVLDMPVHIGVQWSSREAAQNCPKGDIRLAFCQECGFITNLAFNPKLLEYSEAYDNSLHFSSVFQEYARSLATRLIERYNIYDQDVIEIGCGKGDFLALLCEIGNNRGIGFDPSYENQRFDSKAAERITFIQDFYSERYAHYQGDLICCRYVFEHIDQPTDFLKMVRRTIGSREAVVYFEVPNVSLILRGLSVWDIIYEHCSYFSLGSLAYVFAACGFDICNLAETYRGQFIGIEAKPGNGHTDFNIDRWDNRAEIADAVAAFADNYRQRTTAWQNNLEQIERAGQRVIAWGAGAKGVSFLNMLKIQKQVEYIIDINPHKQGSYIAGTGQQIVSAEFLQKYQPNTIIVMNPIYKHEIKQVVNNLGLSPEFLYAY